jgi:hypothetical protein
VRGKLPFALRREGHTAFPPGANGGAPGAKNPHDASVGLSFNDQIGIITPMPNAELDKALAEDRRTDRIAYVTASAFMVGVGFVNATSLLLEAAREGRSLDPRLPWIEEFTSVGVLILLFPAVAWFTRRIPITAETWQTALPLHALASIFYSTVHVTGMILVRKVVFLAVFGEPYTFFGDVLRESFYEYRKDAAAYATFVLMLHLFRSVAEYRREAEVARADAKKAGRITLKSGGRRIMLDAGAVEWARAADNYVEVKTNDRTHLARMTLAALETQLRLAGIDAARVHRSYVVNRAKIAEIIPSGDGDFRVRMSDGTELRGSRRYRAGLAQMI